VLTSRRLLAKAVSLFTPSLYADYVAPRAPCLLLPVMIIARDTRASEKHPDRGALRSAPRRGDNRHGATLRARLAPTARSSRVVMADDVENSVHEREGDMQRDHARNREGQDGMREGEDQEERQGRHADGRVSGCHPPTDPGSPSG